MLRTLLETVPEGRIDGADDKLFEKMYDPEFPLRLLPISVPGQAEVYDPQGTDWYKERVDHFYLLDVYAHLLGWDRELGGTQAQSWMRLRAEKLLARQLRHTERCVFTPAELARTRYPGSEQEVAWLCADAFLLQWLRAGGALSTKSAWLDASPTTAR